MQTLPGNKLEKRLAFRIIKACKSRTVLFTAETDLYFYIIISDLTGFLNNTF